MKLMYKYVNDKIDTKCIFQGLDHWGTLIFKGGKK